MRIFWGFALGIGCIATAAVGQTTAGEELNKEFIPNEDMMMSAGGVDVLSGKYQPSGPDLAFGSDFGFSRQAPPGIPGHFNSMGVFGHNFDIMITERKFDHTKANPNVSGDDYRMGVRFGPLSASFDSLSYESGFTPTGQGREGKLVVSGNRASSTAKYTYTSRNGTVATFRSIGLGDCSTEYRCAYVDHVKYPDGTVLKFSYVNVGGSYNPTVLKSVVSSIGNAFVFDYGNVGGKNVIAKACAVNLAVDPLPANCRQETVNVAVYTYSAIGGTPHMTSATRPGNEEEVYTYSSNGLTQTYKRTGEATPWQTIQFALRQNVELINERVVTSQTFSTGESLLYTSTPAPVFVPGQPLPRGNLVITDSLGGETQYLYDFPVNALAEKLSGSPTPGIPPDFDFNNYRQVEGGPSRIVDELGRTTHYNYCDRLAAQYDVNGDGVSDCQVGYLQDFTLPSGHKTELYYVGPGKVGEYRQIDSTGQLPTRSLVQEFACTVPVCEQKPTKRQDPNGSTTDYVYSTNHGSVIVETQSADAGGVRPQRRYTFAKKYAWIKSGTGFVSNTDGKWVPIKEEYCQTSASANLNVSANSASADCAAGPADEVITTYEYQEGSASRGSNVLLVGKAVTADGQSLRTCYGYDAMGRKISETGPRAGLASCQ
ncbi:hypothetical protein [Erythrobacter aureus]|uniref:RHS repeat protein n=1 Tax=Erythrobacter aureus TaxID=2182384 RepID=A0A345YEL1_9SPHN|nr:hypothetical protein [Erythrobacter aureus]AXK42363.1 hypothetical protein DVR09_08450 [Erythrobacter aureus]